MDFPMKNGVPRKWRILEHGPKMTLFFFPIHVFFEDDGFFFVLVKLWRGEIRTRVTI